MSKLEIASISPDGTITGLKVDNTRVTATVGGKSSSINLLVKMDRLIILDPGHDRTSTAAVPKTENGTQLLDYRGSVLNMQIVNIMKSSNLSATGTSAYYSLYKPGVNDGRIIAIVQDSKDIATRINNAIASLGLIKHGKAVFENDFAVNRLTNMPSALVEVGFLSNITEFRRISQYPLQGQAAEKMVQALKEFYECGSQSNNLNLTP